MIVKKSPQNLIVEDISPVPADISFNNINDFQL